TFKVRGAPLAARPVEAEGRNELDRIKGTSPTRYGIEVPRLSFSVFNLKERGSHAGYYDGIFEVY
ncbi:MAG: hypothetical protein Q7J36_15055, partial [Thiobacillus sp.]|nr:hypothetical protein [Thiobacillus sp.]